MEIVDKGVIDPSFMDFITPSNFAKSSLHYIPQFGHFFCTNEYSISRNHYGLFLFIYVCSGELHIETEGHKQTVTSNQIALIDCHLSHKYHCSTKVEFLWFHFNGNNSRQYYDYLSSQSGIVFSGTHILELKEVFNSILYLGQSTVINEHTLSSNVTYILSKLASSESQKTLVDNPVIPAIRYITSHFSDNLDLDTLASFCNISPSHFIRSFKKYTSCTPHEYLLNYRLRQSKYLLKTTSFSVEEIAERCGFNSASHFARAFRKHEVLSPSEFRNLYF